jgi:peptide/nickel transport system substrate-binding protein
MKKAFTHILLSLIIGLGLFLTACQSADITEEATQEVETEPEVESTEKPTEPPTEEPEEEMAAADAVKLDPATIEGEELLEICGFIYEGLVAVDDDTIVPALATSWKVSDDQLDYIFNLRPNVTFHDGTPLDADIVIANFNRWFEPNHPLHGDNEYAAWQEAFGGFEGEVDSEGLPKSSFDGIEKVNNLTVLIHLNRQDPELLQKLARTQFSMINTASLEDQGELYGTRQGSTVGTGPYTLAEWMDDGLLLSPYSEYWGTPPESELELNLP